MKYQPRMSTNQHKRILPQSRQRNKPQNNTDKHRNNLLTNFGKILWLKSVVLKLYDNFKTQKILEERKNALNIEGRSFLPHCGKALLGLTLFIENKVP